MAKNNQKVIYSEDTAYSQVIDSPDDRPNRDGCSLVTRNHEVIMKWAENRNALPATIDGTQNENGLGVLRLDFDQLQVGASPRLKKVGWDEWFDTFDKRRLNFVYQETKADGTQSNFFRLDNPKRPHA